MDIRRAGEMLEYRLGEVARSGIAAQAIIRVEFRVERTPTALPAFFILLPTLGLIRPALSVKLLGLLVGGVRSCRSIKLASHTGHCCEPPGRARCRCRSKMKATH